MTAERFQAKLERWSRRNPKEIKRELDDIGRDLVKTVNREHLSGPKMPRGQTSRTRPTIDSKGPLRTKTSARVSVRPGRVVAEVRNTHGLAATLHEGAVRTSRGGKPFIFRDERSGRWVITHRIRIPGRPFVQAPVQNELQKNLERLAKRLTRSYEQA